jgi:hypothetical protein
MAGGVVAPPPPTPAPPPERPAGSRRQRGRVLLAAGAGGAGVLALAAAGAFAISAKARYRDYKDEQARRGCEVSCSAEDIAALGALYDRSTRRADLATGFVIGGAALVAGGLVLYLTAPRERIAVAPLASQSAVGLAAAFRF